MSEKTYSRKNVPFDLSKPDEKELWEWLQSLPHGAFSEVTKQFWKTVMGNKSNVMNIMHDEFWEKTRKEYFQESEDK